MIKMPHLYALKNAKKASQAYAALYAASHYKKNFIGVYYHPGTGRLLPVFNMPAPSPRHSWAFQEIQGAVLEESFRMLCPACGLCCARNSAAFAFPHELPPYYRDKLPRKSIPTKRYGELEILLLDTDTAGRCVFLDTETAKCALQEKGYMKPVNCMLHYCTMFAEKKGKIYVKIGLKRENKPIYREITEKEYLAIADKLRKKALKFASHEPSRNSLKNLHTPK